MMFTSFTYKSKHLFKLVFSYLSFEITRFTWANYLFTPTLVGLLLIVSTCL